MKSVVEPLEGNKVKLSVEVDEQEFEQALDSAFRKIAREVRIPGFRPGKAPRRLLEARIGADAARQEALRDALPDYYAQAVREQELDVIAAPAIDITSGEDGGAVAFAAVVEVRPQVSIAGYGGLQVTVPSPEVTEEEVDAQVDRVRNQFGELQAVDRPVATGDYVTIDLKGEREGAEPLAADDYLYEVGSGTAVSGLDEQLQGAKVGDILEYEADGARFRVFVKDVKEKILPEADDEWASEASEFDTLAELRDDIRTRLGMVKRLQVAVGIRDEALKALVELVVEDAPEPLVDEEVRSRLHDLAHRVEAQGGDLVQYIQASGLTQEQFLDALRTEAQQAVKADLALRALADAEAVEATDEDVDQEIERLAERFERKPAQIRRDLERGDGIAAVRSDLRKSKALAWLVEHVEVVDEQGNPIDRAEFLSAPEQPEQPEQQVEDAEESRETE